MPNLTEAELHLRKFLEALDVDLSTEDTKETPRRVTEMYAHELLVGTNQSLKPLFESVSEATPDSPQTHVAIGPIEATIVCPHHLLPSKGTVRIAYLPHRKILGFGAFVDLVSICSKRLILQEELGNIITESLITFLDAKSASCQLWFEPMCVNARITQCVATATVTHSGLASIDPVMQLEALGMLQMLPLNDKHPSSKS